MMPAAYPGLGSIAVAGRRLRWLLALAATVAAAPVAAGDGDPALASDRQRYSYAIGVLAAQDMIGQGLNSGGMELDIDAFEQAVRDVWSGQPTKVPVEEMKSVYTRFRDRQTEELKARARNIRKAGEDFCNSPACKLMRDQR